jgi:hypothetical protein
MMLEDLMIHGGWPHWSGPARIEHDTPLVPQAVATAVWEEAGAWLGEELPREWRTRLRERAEALYARNPRVRRRLRSPGNGGRDWLWTFMRHWLAALLWQQRPDLHARLPGAFNTGHPLPPKPTAPQRPRAATDTQIDRLVYGLYGLTQDEIKLVESNR